MLFYAAINIITFVIWGVDKFKAISKQWRVPERVLVSLILLGGAFGALAGMLVFHHKTRKKEFWVLVGVGILLHLAIYFLIVR